jgi:hypothetical protein
MVGCSCIQVMQPDKLSKFPTLTIDIIIYTLNNYWDDRTNLFQLLALQSGGC